jgi:hypothetical protein
VPSVGGVTVNDALIPAITAAVGGAALGGAILVSEARAESAMRASRVRLALTFPASVDPLHVKAALSAIAGISDRLELILETEATEGGIRHYLWVPAEVRVSVVSSLAGALPGVRAIEAPEPAGRTTIAATVYLPTPLVLLAERPEAAARTLLAGIAGLSAGERAVLKWAIRPGSPRSFTPREPVTRATREIERAWRRKVASGPGFQTAGLVVVQASTLTRAREITEHITSSLRSRRGAVGSLRITTDQGGRSMAARPKTNAKSGWASVSELVGLCGLPIGSGIPGVVASSRALMVPKHVPTTGRFLLTGRDSAGRDRRVALSYDAARLHLGLFGKTGSGKTTALVRLVLDSLTENVGGIYVDPKDGLQTLLDHVSPEQAEKIIVLDPAAPGPVPGLDLFGVGDAMRADVILSVLKGVSDGWGPRIQRFLSIGLRAIEVLDDPVLYDWLSLYSDPGFRRSVTARISDPVIAAEWRVFEEGMSPAEQAVFAGPAIARVSDLLSRPALRAVLSQPHPRLNIGRALDEGRWVCVAASPGTLGEPASHLLTAVVTYLAWATVERRAAIPPEQRRQVMLVLDELGSLSHLPIGPEVFFERLRSLNCCVVAAGQAPSRLPLPVQQSLFANVGSLLVLGPTGADEASRLARDLAPLTPQDLMSLHRYEIAGRVSTGGEGSGSAVVTGHTEPLPPATGQGAFIRRLSAERYGRDPREIEEELRRRSRNDDGQSGSGGGYGRTGRAM